MLKNPIPASTLNTHNPQNPAPSPPLTLECHSQGFTGRDQILTEDGTTIMFYYDHHSSFGGWDAELKAGGPAGPVVCRASKGFSSSFKVNFPDGSQAECVSTGLMSVTHEFRSPSTGTHYKWKNVGEFVNFAESFMIKRSLEIRAGIPGSGTELAVSRTLIL